MSKNIIIGEHKIVFPNLNGDINKIGNFLELSNNKILDLNQPNEVVIITKKYFIHKKEIIRYPKPISEKLEILKSVKANYNKIISIVINNKLDLSYILEELRFYFKRYIFNKVLDIESKVSKIEKKDSNQLIKNITEKYLKKYKTIIDNYVKLSLLMDEKLNFFETIIKKLNKDMGKDFLEELNNKIGDLTYILKIEEDFNKVKRGNDNENINNIEMDCSNSLNVSFNLLGSLILEFNNDIVTIIKDIEDLINKLKLGETFDNEKISENPNTKDEDKKRENSYLNKSNVESLIDDFKFNLQNKILITKIKDNKKIYLSKDKELNLLNNCLKMAYHKKDKLLIDFFIERGANREVLEEERENKREKKREKKVIDFFKDIESSYKSFSYKELTELTTIKLVNMNLTNLSILKYLTNLKSINLSNNKVIDISFVTKLTRLTYLHLANNEIEYLFFLKVLKNLSYLNISKNKIVDISFLEGLNYLGYLNLSNNQIKDISVLKNLTNLTELSLFNNKIINISSLKNLTNLTYLNLANNKIVDTYFMKNLKNLTHLNLSNTNITDISFIKDLKEISYLYLYKNQIKDISVLKNLKNLKYLYLYNNQIKDISVLKNLKSLKYLYISNNPIKDFSAIKHIENVYK